MDAERVSEQETDLPPSSPELWLIRLFVESFLETASPKQARAFMRVANGIAERAESAALPIRAAARTLEAARAMRSGLAAYREMEPTLMARVPPR